MELDSVASVNSVRMSETESSDDEAGADGVGDQPEPGDPDEPPVDAEGHGDGQEDRVEMLCRAIAKVKSKFSMTDTALEELLTVTRKLSNFSANF